MSAPIEDYAVIGDSRTCALIGPDGSLDWLCLPNLDSAACFAALLGTSDHGRWQLVAPAATAVTRTYDGGSFVLVTTITTPTGVARLTECMPLAEDSNNVVRSLACLEGEVAFRHELVVRFGYGKVAPWASRGVDPTGEPVLRLVAGPDALTLHATRLPRGRHHRHEDEFTLRAGERADFCLTWTPSWRPVPMPPDIDAMIEHTRCRWDAWSDACAYNGAHPDAVRRSLLVLRLLTSDETGGIAAAATTSLPEDFGGVRNWDYRYCWLRDAARTLDALLEFGYGSEVLTWRQWLLRAVAGDPEDMLIMYRLDGGRDLPEIELDHLPGYAGSRPVRIGNAAVAQVQHDVLGEVMAALDSARAAGIEESADSWSLQVHLVDEMLRTWREPDRGIWEIRGDPQHFTLSKIMCWVAVDRGLSGIETYGLPGPRQRWRKARDEIRADVLAHGVDAATGSFVQHYATTEVDASLLMMVSAGFLPPTDPRVIATVRRIRDELSAGPHVLRYRTSTGVDGLPGGEHYFLACSFWLVDALAQIGELDEAGERMAALVALSNGLGLFAEEYDPVARRFVGNFPQALSHLALVRAAHTLDMLASPLPPATTTLWRGPEGC